MLKNVNKRENLRLEILNVYNSSLEIKLKFKNNWKQLLVKYSCKEFLPSLSLVTVCVAVFIFFPTLS